MEENLDTTKDNVFIDNLNKSISILIQGVTIAQNKGIYSFEESRIIAEALNFLESINVSKEKET